MGNVLFICEYCSIYSGNFIKSLLFLTRELEKKTCQCYFVFPELAEQRDWIKMFNRKRVSCLSFNTKYFKFVKIIASIVDESNIEIIHSHFLSPNKAKLISIVCSKTKMMVHLHSDFSGGNLSRRAQLKNFLTYHVMVSRLHFLCVSREFVKYNPKISSWIPNSVVLDDKERNVEEICSVRRKYNVGDDDILVELFGWSPRVKGVDIAVEAIKKINGENNNASHFYLMIVCGVQYNEAEMRKYIAEHTSCTGEEDFLIYAPPTEDVFLLHNSADILLSASRSEGFSYSIVEMLSLGKRCVVSNIPGTTWAKEFQSVVSFISEDSLDCKNALLQASKLDNYNETVEKSIKDKYSIDKWVRAVIDAYRSEGK